MASETGRKQAGQRAAAPVASTARVPVYDHQVGLPQDQLRDPWQSTAAAAAERSRPAAVSLVESVERLLEILP